VPGHFVSPDLRSDCARFLDDVKSIVARRRDSKHESSLSKIRRERPPKS
jgi:hypothetical protein